jgi:hypothetical protein
MQYAPHLRRDSVPHGGQRDQGQPQYNPDERVHIEPDQKATKNCGRDLQQSAQTSREYEVYEKSRVPRAPKSHLELFLNCPAKRKRSSR